MSASKDVLAFASLEVDLSSIEPGTTITVKWRGKALFIRHRNEEDIKLANSVDVGSLYDPQQDSDRLRILNGSWLLVFAPIWVASLYQMPVILVVGFVHAMVPIMTSQAELGKARHHVIWKYLLILFLMRTSY